MVLKMNVAVLIMLLVCYWQLRAIVMWRLWLFLLDSISIWFFIKNSISIWFRFFLPNIWS